MNNATNPIRPRTVKLIARILQPLADEGVLSIPEMKEIIVQLKCLAERGETLPVVTPKLIDQTEAAEILGVSLSNFKKLETENAFPFKRKMVGSAVRYRNTNIIEYVMTNN